MKELIPYLIGGGIGLGGLSAFLWNFIKESRAEKETAAKAKVIATEALDKAQGALVLVIKDEVEAWKARHKFEHEELLAARTELEEYRTKVHDKRNEINKQVLDLTVEIAECKAKTDMTPVLNKLIEQTKQFGEQLKINIRVARILDSIAKHLKLEITNGNGNGGTPA